jgi:uncharacterized protein
VAVLANEVVTERAQTWLGRQQAGTLLISDWVVTEFASALSIKVRTGELNGENRALLAEMFTRLRTESLIVVPVTRGHFATAARFVEQVSLGLRAADALHVAIAAEQGASICTLDRRMAEAATQLAVSAQFL